MNIFLTCLFNGLYKEYIWLHKEYEKNWNKTKRYSELTPKEIKIIINKYESGLIDGSTNKLIFKKVIRIENILNKRLKKYQARAIQTASQPTSQQTNQNARSLEQFKSL